MQYVPLNDNNNVKVLAPAPPTGLPAQVVDANFTAVVDALNAKQASLGYTAENSANKSTDVSADGGSDAKYPSAKAVKAYCDASAVSRSVIVKTTNYGMQGGDLGQGKTILVNGDPAGITIIALPVLTENEVGKPIIIVKQSDGQLVIQAQHALIAGVNGVASTIGCNDPGNLYTSIYLMPVPTTQWVVIGPPIGAYYGISWNFWAPSGILNYSSSGAVYFVGDYAHDPERGMDFVCQSTHASSGATLADDTAGNWTGAPWDV